MDLLSWIGVLIILYVIYLVYMSWHFRVFTRQGIQMAGTPIPCLGTLNEVFQKGPVEAYRGYTEKYGITYGEIQGRVPVLSTIDPAIIKEVFIKQHRCFFYATDMFKGEKYCDEILPTMTNYDHWKFYRSVLSPAFSTGKLKRMISKMNNCANKMMTELNDKQTTDITDAAALFTIDVIANTTFGIDIKYNENSDFVRMAKKPMHNLKGMVVIALTANFLPFISQYINPLFNRLGFTLMDPEPLEYFRSITRQLIEQRRAQPEEDHFDFLQLMLNAHKDLSDEEDGGEKPDRDTLRELSIEEILSQSSLFITAAMESTAASIAYLAYNLACNPDEQNKLIDEIDRICPAGTEITYSMLNEMPYVDMCVNESLRMFPPFTQAQRTANQDTTLSNGIFIPNGGCVKVPVYWLHHCDEFYPEPEKFIPERFSSEEKAKRDLATFMSFSAGPRMCIAVRLAIVEIKLGIIAILQQYNLHLDPSTDVPMKFKTEFLLKPLNPINLRLEKRIG